MYLHILHTGKKVRLQICIDHKMFDIFTSRNVKKKSLNIHSHVRPRCPTKTTMSDQIVGLRECWLSNLSDILGGICRTWEYDRWYTWSVLYIISVCLLWDILWNVKQFTDMITMKVWWNESCSNMTGSPENEIFLKQTSTSIFYIRMESNFNFGFILTFSFSLPNWEKNTLY